MDGWHRFKHTSMPDKREFCSNLAMGNIADAVYKQEKRAREDLEIQNLGECDDL